MGRNAMGASVAFGLRDRFIPLVDFILPQHCLACSGELSGSSSVHDSPMLCRACSGGLRRAHGMGGMQGIDEIASAYTYAGTARTLVHKFKYGDQIEIARLFAREMRTVGAGLLAANDVLVSVPLHARRLLRRRYNQSAILSKLLSRERGAPIFAPELLRRGKATRPSARLSPAARHSNLEDAFTVPSQLRSRVTGARILLVDDVLTTGATARHCAQALRQAGARSVDLLTATRSESLE